MKDVLKGLQIILSEILKEVWYKVIPMLIIFIIGAILIILYLK